MTWYLLPSLVAAVVGAATGALLPRVIARLPEPEPDPSPAEDGAVDGLVPAKTEAELARPVDEPKELYADLARRPGLAWKLAVATGLASARSSAAGSGWDAGRCCSCSTSCRSGWPWR